MITATFISLELLWQLYPSGQDGNCNKSANGGPSGKESYCPALGGGAVNRTVKDDGASRVVLFPPIWTSLKILCGHQDVVWQQIKSNKFLQMKAVWCTETFLLEDAVYCKDCEIIEWIMDKLDIRNARAPRWPCFPCDGLEKQEEKKHSSFFQCLDSGLSCGSKPVL